MDQEYQGHVLAEQAEKKLNPGCWEALCTSKEERMDQAKDFYQRAGNCFKLVKKWFEAGECYEKAARIEEQTQGDPTTFYEEAAHCFKFDDKTRSFQNSNKAVAYLESKGRFATAGDNRKKLAEEYENEGEYALAINEYKKASEYYEMDTTSSKMHQQTCLLKVADLMCLMDHQDAFDQGKQIYEKVGFQYLSVPLLKSNAGSLFFKCVVLYLIFDDDVSAGAYLSKFETEDPSFYDSREDRLLKEVIESMKEKNLIRFKTAFTRYKEVADVDKWKIHMFTKILKKIEKDSSDNADIQDFL